jgi:hypothetical protein
MTPHLRIARPVTDLQRTETMYCHGVGLVVLARSQKRRRTAMKAKSIARAVAGAP